MVSWYLRSRMSEGGFGLGAWGGVGGFAAESGSGALDIENISPSVVTVLGENDQVLFNVITPDLPLQVVIVAEFPSVAISELVYADGSLSPYYNNSQSFGVATVDGYSFSIFRTPKWPAREINIRVFAADASGNMLTQTLTWDVEQAVAPTIVTTNNGVAAGFSASSADPLGFGIIRPFRRVPTNDFATASGASLVRAAVGQVLGTARGDVPWRPSFGTILTRLRHMRNVQALPEIARISIEDALKRWEPRIQVTDVSAAPATGENSNKVILSVVYRISSSQPDIVRLLV